MKKSNSRQTSQEKQPGTPTRASLPSPKVNRSGSGSNLNLQLQASPKVLASPKQAVKPSPQGSANRSNSGNRQSSNSPGVAQGQVRQQQQKPNVQRLQQVQQVQAPKPQAQQKPQASKFKPISYSFDTPAFADDHPIVESKNKDVATKEYDILKLLHLDVRSKSKNVQLGAEPVYQPVMITIRTEDDEEEPNQELPKPQEETKEAAKQVGAASNSASNRVLGIDLVCVIDHSGSMQGQKMALVRQTLEYVLDQLTDIDRLCLIQFDDQCQRLNPLLPLTEDNKAEIRKVISKLSDNGGTDINLGMNCAFEQLKQRTKENAVTSIFLLSDGLDGGAEKKVAQSFFSKFKPLVEKTFTIHSFGFGSDHDPKLMSEIATLRDGNFYFIQDLTKLDECFIDALGALFSVVAQDILITISLNVQVHPYVKPICSQTYGEMWYKKSEEKFEIKIAQLMSGVSKDFLMEIQFPAFDAKKLQDHERNIEVMQIVISGLQTTSSGDKKPFNKAKNLMLTLFGEGENIGEIEEDGEVMENYCRVQAALAMKAALDAGNQGKYEEGQKIVEKAMNIIELCKKNKKVNFMKIEGLQKDLIQTKEQCNPQAFQKYGKHNMIMMQKCHMEQKSKGVMREEEGEEMNFYANKKQKAMQVQLKSKKC